MAQARKERCSHSHSHTQSDLLSVFPVPLSLLPLLLLYLLPLSLAEEAGGSGARAVFGRVKELEKEFTQLGAPDPSGSEASTLLRVSGAPGGDGSGASRTSGPGAVGVPVGSDSRSQALVQELRECQGSAGASAPEACRLAQAVLRSALERAEEQYSVNIRNRNALDRGTLLTNPLMPQRRMKEALMVPTWPCPLEGRFGIWGEGGKWLCLVHSGVTQGPTTVSIGSRGDVSFEREMYARLNATIDTFDPTLKDKQQSWMRTIPYLKFHNAGLSGKEHIQSTLASFPPAFNNSILLTVPQLFQFLNASYIDVLKIDCEGCEYGVVEDMTTLYTRNTVPFGQILMEMHFIMKKHIQARDLVASLEGLGYRMFHAEQNALCEECYEVAYIHQSLTRL